MLGRLGGQEGDESIFRITWIPIHPSLLLKPLREGPWSLRAMERAPKEWYLRHRVDILRAT